MLEVIYEEKDNYIKTTIIDGDNIETISNEKGRVCRSFTTKTDLKIYENRIIDFSSESELIKSLSATI